MKKCCTCKVEKSEIYFGRDNQSKSGLRCECKECRNIKSAHSYKLKKISILKKRRLKYKEMYIDFKIIKIETSKINRRIRNNLRKRIRNVLRSNNIIKSNLTIDLVGCSSSHLKSHLEKQFKWGMSWDNYGAWEIDHIRPCKSFDLTDVKQQMECFNYMNLQPLWAIENRKKGAKLTY